MIILEQGESLVKLKTAAYVLLGFTISWAISSFIDIRGITHIVLPLFLLIGIVHELLHLISISIFKIKHRFVVKGLYLGFIINVDDRKRYVITALFPQILTVIMMLFYIITLNSGMLILAILHIAISIEDIGRCLKYVVSYS